MRPSIVLLGMASWVGLSHAIVMESAAGSTKTITKTSTSVIHIPTPAGWLPADLTRNTAPRAPPAQIKVPNSKDVTKILMPHLNVIKATAACDESATVTTTAVAFATTTSFDACQDHRNFVTDAALDATSGVDGVCDCEINTMPHTASVENAQECCHLCWADIDCIGSAWSNDPRFGPSCLWITATTCGTKQGFNYSMSSFLPLFPSSLFPIR